MDTARPTPSRLRSLPSWSINQVAIAANHLTDQALAGTGARRHHFALLSALAEFGPSSQADLGRCTAIDRSDVVSAINALADQGFVDRRTDPAHARRNLITLTPAGEAHLADLTARLAEAQQTLLRTLTHAESTQLVHLLLRIADDHRPTP